LRNLHRLRTLYGGRRSSLRFLLLFSRALRRLLGWNQEGREEEDEAEDDEDVVPKDEASEHDDCGEYKEPGVRLPSKGKG
jgi:hypothetical protein